MERILEDWRGLERILEVLEVLEVLVVLEDWRGLKRIGDGNWIGFLEFILIERQFLIPNS